MPQQVATSVENNFTKGLITESTGLNFPENAATDTDNCVYTLVGDVTRRLGINKEINGSVNTFSRLNLSIASYKWNNAGGDGFTQVVVEQVGPFLYFYRSSTATVSSPLSTQILASVVNLSAFQATGVIFDNTLECQFADGNGYLFVFHPSCDPIYCTYNLGTVTANSIQVNIRDFTGIPENIGNGVRPTTLTVEHNYNLLNQGWVSGNPWVATAPGSIILSSSMSFTVASGIAGIANGQRVNITNLITGFDGQGNQIPAGTVMLNGTVTSYVGTTLVIAITGEIPNVLGLLWVGGFNIIPMATAYLQTWFSDEGNYPSNADVWWYFKDSSGTYNPTTTALNTSVGTGQAPRGHFILNAFNQNKSGLSGLSVTNITTQQRPSAGCWFQGRIWYTGVNAQQPAIGDAPYYTWTENIYFSQIVNTPSDFGSCYQTNDPTSETLFDLLPTDGGVISIQGCGGIYKLFPLMNALLIFAANGVWYLAGNQGVGFTANDYTIVKLSAVRSISSTSFVDVNGLPMFWNEEGIYSVEPAKQGQGLLNSPLHVNPLEVNSITVGTILGFYTNIPAASLRYARGVYDPVNYVVQWIFKSTPETSVGDRYSFDSLLNFNTYNKAFYPYSIDNSTNSINSIIYVASPGGTTAPDPMVKYFSSNATQLYFADEHDTTYVDWGSKNYLSFFITGYKIRGQAIKKFQPQYIRTYARTNGAPYSYKLQGIWDFANNQNSGRWTALQTITSGLPYNYNTVSHRHKIRGHGYVLQFKVQSTDGMPFDIQGWAVVDTVNAGT